MNAIKEYLDGGGAIAFGLVQQGHIPTVKQMRSEHKSWDDIGKVIGWDGPTAQQHYEWHLESSLASVTRERDAARERVVLLTTLLEGSEKYVSLYARPSFAKEVRAALAPATTATSDGS